jgi:ribonuclease HII
VILKPGARIPGLRESKLLSPAKRRRLVKPILCACEAWGIGAVSATGIDRHNIRRASFRAMRIALEKTAAICGCHRMDHVIVDGFRIPGLRIAGVTIRQTAIIKGDRRCRSVAAASVLAKVARDRKMDLYHRAYTAYGFDRNRGYATPAHLDALDRLGPCPLHRKSFMPVQRAGQFSLPF